MHIWVDCVFLLIDYCGVPQTVMTHQKGAAALSTASCPAALWSSLPGQKIHSFWSLTMHDVGSYIWNSNQWHYYIVCHFKVPWLLLFSMKKSVTREKGKDKSDLACMHATLGLWHVYVQEHHQLAHKYACRRRRKSKVPIIRLGPNLEAWKVVISAPSPSRKKNAIWAYPMVTAIIRRPDNSTNPHATTLHLANDDN